MHHSTTPQSTTPSSIAQGLFDEDGFLLDAQDWTPELAADIAEMEGIDELSERHFQVIGHVRDEYFRHGGLPTARLVCKATGIPVQDLFFLFGGCRAIWRIAGLPDPGEEAKAYFG